MGSKLFKCEFCGEMFLENSQRDIKSTRFCSSSCAHKYSSSKKDLSNKGPFYEVYTCEVCGKEFSRYKGGSSQYKNYCEDCKREVKSKEEKALRTISPQKCQCCGTIFTYDYRSLETIKKGIPPKFCSFKCSHSRPKTDQQKQHLSKVLKSSEKAKLATKRMKELRNTEEWLQSHPHIKHPRISKMCPICGKMFETTESRNKKYCSNDCWKRVSGGFREGSVKNYKHGYVEDYYYDSSWEETWLKWALLKGIHFERNKQGFPYIFKGKQHHYYPDFYLPDSDEYVEIKGFQDEQWQAKREAFPHKLTVYTQAEIQCIERDLNFL